MLFERLAARAALLAVCAALFFPLACGRSAAPPHLVLHTDTASPDFGTVDVEDLEPAALRALNRSAPALEQWQELLLVQIVSADSGADALPLLGRYTVTDNRLRFTPRFAPAPGQVYRVRFDGAAVARVTGLASTAPVTRLDSTWQVAALNAPASTTVLQIYPSSDTLPVNLLRIYLHFSAPMSMGEAYRRVQLLDENGRAVPDAFLVVSGEKELWDPQRQRLTLLFDPGRIKRDLRPNLELGLPLRAGHNFTLAVDSTWQDARGRPLLRPFRKSFTVVAADRASPRTQDWQVTAPRAGTRDPLVLTFPEPLDQALLERLLQVKRADGAVVAGAIKTEENERRWLFVPDTPWQSGAHRIEVGTELEDPAGNSMRRLFDVDRTAAPAPTVTVERVLIEFTVR